MKKTWLSIALGGAFVLAPVPGYAQTSAAPCEFVLGFKTLHDMAASNVGDCTDDQNFAANGDALQHTNKGLLAWRKLDNWTAFTNGYMTWLNSPSGLVTRLNTQRYPWEADYTAPGIIKIPPPAPAMVANGRAWTVAFDHNLLLPSIDVDDGSGHAKPQQAAGKWINVYFWVRNNQPKAAKLAVDNIKLGDSQGRGYSSEFELREVASDGHEVPFGGTLQPQAVALLRLTFDVAKDATGGVLHVPGGNDVAAL